MELWEVMLHDDVGRYVTSGKAIRLSRRRQRLQTKLKASTRRMEVRSKRLKMTRGSPPSSRQGRWTGTIFDVRGRSASTRCIYVEHKLLTWVLTGGI